MRTDNVQLTLGPHDASSRVANDACAAVFLDGVRSAGLRWVQSVEVERKSGLLGDITAFGEVVLRWRDDETEDAVLRVDDEALVLLVGCEGMCEVVAAADDHDVAAGVARRLGEALEDPPAPDARLPVRFWSMGGCGAEWVQRRVPADPWDDVAQNYPAAVRAQLEALMAMREPAGGSLVLWHGPPGTGKTHALRALADAWRSWATTHYVTDPEKLLQGTGYLMEVATARASDAHWRLVVLEDAGELMSASARSEVGQGLSRVLNLSDGLLGQGVNCLLLVTTNEPLGRLHPAVLRPGRCLATIDFPPFAPDEATAWLALHGVERALRAPASLAQLFAIADGREPVGASGGARAFGFAQAL